jgi:hypothetical protein
MCGNGEEGGWQRAGGYASSGDHLGQPKRGAVRRARHTPIARVASPVAAWLGGCGCILEGVGAWPKRGARGTGGARDGQARGASDVGWVARREKRRSSVARRSGCGRPNGMNARGLSLSIAY